MLNFIIIVLLIIWIIVYRKNRNFMATLPYLLITFITPIYNFLDKNIFVKVLGFDGINVDNLTGGFDANDLRKLIYVVFGILEIILGLVVSKRLERKEAKIIYMISIIIVNILLSIALYKTYMWK